MSDLVSAGMGPALGCPLGQAGVCETSDGARRSVERLRRSFSISILMQSYLGLAIRQLKFVEFELLGLRLSLTMGHRVGLAIKMSRS